MTPSDPISLAPDLTLAECCDRWGVSSRNSIKARAAALGVALRRESSTRTVWPAEHVALGDDLAEHLARGGKLASFPRSLTAPAGGSDDGDGVSVMAPAGGSDRPKRAGGLAVTAPAGGSDAMQVFAQLAAAMAPQAPADPLAVARGLAEAAELGAWLTTAELAQLLKVSPGTPATWWKKGQAPRPGFALERRTVGKAVWWRVTAGTD